MATTVLPGFCPAKSFLVVIAEFRLMIVCPEGEFSEQEIKVQKSDGATALLVDDDSSEG